MKTPLTLAGFALLLAAPAARLHAGAGAELPESVPTCPSPQPIAPAQIVAGSKTGARSNPVWNGREFGVAYTDNVDGHLHFVRIYADGTTAAPPVNLTSRASYNAPSLVWNGSGYGVAWQEASPVPNNQIYFARLNPDGTMIGSELKVSFAGAADTAGSYFPALAWSGSGYAVIWQDLRNTGTTGWDLYVTLLDSAGAIANGGASHDLSVGIAAGSQINPAIAWSQGYGAFLAVWEDYRNVNTQIYRALIAPTGTVGTASSTVSGASNSLTPSIADTGNGLGLVWADFRDTNFEIYFARLSVTGNKIGLDVRLTNDGNGSSNPRIVWTGGEYGVAWLDNRGGVLAETWFQRVSQAGAPVGGNLQVTYSGDNELSDLAFGGKGYLFTGTYNVGPVVLTPWGCSADATPPTCPGNFQAYNITGTSATVTWSPSGDAESDIAYYQVYRNNTLIGKTSAEYYGDSGLPLSSTNNYMIQPVNAWQQQNNGCTASIYVKTNSSLTLTLGKSSPDAVLNWTDAGFNNYNIFRGYDPRVMSQIGATPALTSPDANALNDTLSYFYSVDNPGP